MDKILRKFNLIFILLLFFIVTIIITYPAILNLNSKLIGDGGDNYQNLVFQYIASQNIKNFQLPFSHSDILRYPVGFNFGAGSESILTILTGAFLSFFMNSVFAYNLTLLIFFTLNGYFSFILFRYVSKNYILGLIGGLIYGYSSYVIARSAGHLNLFFVGGFPLLLYSILKNNDNFTVKNITLILISLTLIFLGSFAYTVLLISAIIICPLILLLFYKNHIHSFVLNILKKIRKIFLILIPVLLIMITFGFSHFQAYMTGNYFKPDRSDNITLIQYSPSIKDFFLPNSYLPLQITELTKNLNNSFKSIERIVFMGWIEIFIFALFILFYKNKREKYFIVSIVLAFFILSLGLINPETKIYLPYYFLHKILPFSFVDEPARFFVIFYLFMVVGIILFLKQEYKNDKKTKLFLIIISALIILERLPFNYWLSPTFTDSFYIQNIKKSNGSAVLDIPVSYTNSVYDILPYLYGKKVVSAPFHWFADTEQPKSFIKESSLTRFICGENFLVGNLTKLENIKLTQTLVNNNIKTIVVHKNDPEDHAKYYFPECANARMQSSILLPQLFMPDPTSKQKILSIFFPAIPDIGDTITIPYDGAFYIDGIHAYPSDRLPLHMTIDDKKVAMNQNWTLHENKNITLDPFLKLDVKKNSKIKFYFENSYNINYSFVKIWYRYAPNNKNVYPITINRVTKVYEDDEAAVFYINK